MYKRQILVAATLDDATVNAFIVYSPPPVNDTCAVCEAGVVHVVVVPSDATYRTTTELLDRLVPVNAGNTCGVAVFVLLNVETRLSITLDKSTPRNAIATVLPV